MPLMHNKETKVRPWQPAILVILAIVSPALPRASAQPADATDGSYRAHVTIDRAGRSRPISPYIYGVSAASPVDARKYGITTIRWGGNRSSRYNWKAKADNAGSDWFFLNGKAGAWSEFVVANRKAGISSYVTVPLLAWVARSPEGWGFSVAKYGPQQKVEQYVADRGNGLLADGSPIPRNDPRETSIESTPSFQAEGIKAIPKGKLPIIFGLDNEPMLWSHTHRDVHPSPATYEEVFTRGRDYALAIKGADPAALVAGPCTWGWTDLSYSAADEGSDRYATHPDHRAHGNLPFLAWYLGQMKRASDKEGKRLLDLVDVHFYPQGQSDGQGIHGGKTSTNALRALRIRSTRGLWDKSYKDESWINEPVRLIPRVRDWIEKQYPGTKICIGEYSWGGDDDAGGAVAQAEVLGILARERVDYAYFWAGLGGVQRFAFQLYRNPDGKGNGFGSKFLSSRSDAPDRLSSFAALRDDGALTVVLVNKDVEHPAHVSLDLGAKPAKSVLVFRLPNPPASIKREQVKAQGKLLSVVLPPLSAVLVVMEAS